MVIYGPSENACLRTQPVLTSSFALPTISGSMFRINSSVTGAVEPEAVVTATNEATRLAYKTISSSAGEFSFQDLPPGSYLIEITASGFQKTQFKNVVVLAGKIYTLDGKLNVAQQSSTVDVSAAAVSLDTTSVSDDTVLSTQTVQDIPINGRDFTQLVDQSASFSGCCVGPWIAFLINGSLSWQVGQRITTIPGAIWCP